MNEKAMTTNSGKMSLSAAFATPSFQSAIHNALQDSAKEKTFVSSIIAASTINPVLQECTPKSVLSCALVGESLKLCPSPQLGHYYFVPYESKVKDRNGRDVLDEKGHPVKQKTAQFQMGYKGYVQLALRTGQYRTITCLSIKQGELKRWNPLTEEIDVQLIEDEDERENAETIGYFAGFEYLNGFRKYMYWSKSKMEKHALRYSKGYAAKKGYTFWEKDFDGMAYKTMLRQLISKWGIMSTEMQMAFEKDTEIVEANDGSQVVMPAGEPVVEVPVQPEEEEQPIEVDQETGEVMQVNFDEL